MRRAFLMIYVGVALALIWSHSSEAATSWSQIGAGLVGKPVSALVVNPNDTTELAAISQGELYESSTSGLIWERQTTPGVVTAVAYDSAHAGRLWVGMSNTCLAEREAGSVTWTQYGQSTSCYVSTLVPTHDGVFFLDAAHGSVTLLDTKHTLHTLPYSGEQPYYLAAESSGNALYAGSDNTLERSDDDGETWNALARPPDAGCCVADLTVNGTAVWQLAAGRPYVSSNRGESWTGIGPAASARYGLGRLMVRGDTPYFSMVYDGNIAPDIVTQATTPEAGLGLDQFANGITVSSGWLTAATSSGVWRYGVQLPSLAKRLRPVIVIPGLAGSWPKEGGLFGELVLDPILHTYDGLLARLRAAGFNEADGTLVPFPYQWRQDNAISARQLAAVIAATTAACRCAKVDIVAHSMGGLVARQYIESDEYKNDVARLVEVATPNHGSPLAYPVWEDAKLSADSFDVAQGALAKLLIELVRVEGLTKHYVSVIDYIRLGIPSVGQLLPDASYIDNRTYADGYPANHFLETLNTAAAMTRLKKRVELYVVGSNSKPTITSIGVATSANGAHAWPDGQELVRHLGPGDNTVPSMSLDGLGQANLLMNADHGSIVTVAADKIVAYLLGDMPDEVYDTTVPDVTKLKQAVTKTPTVSKPKKAVLVHAKAGAKLSVKSTAKTKASTKTYHTSDENGDYVIILPGDDDTGGSVTVSANPDEPTSVGVVEVTDGGDDDPLPINSGTIDSPEPPDPTSPPAVETTVTDTTGPTDVEVGYGDQGVSITTHDTGSTTVVSSNTPIGNAQAHQQAASGVNPTQSITRPMHGVTTRKPTHATSMHALTHTAVTSLHEQKIQAAAKHYRAELTRHPHLPIIFAIGLVIGGLIWLLLVWLWLWWRRRRVKRSADRTSDQA